MRALRVLSAALAGGARRAIARPQRKSAAESIDCRPCAPHTMPAAAELRREEAQQTAASQRGRRTSDGRDPREKKTRRGGTGAEDTDAPERPK
eukprot:scaffold24203_cov30-Tisochrysis_lutea.AAC.1